MVWNSQESSQGHDPTNVHKSYFGIKYYGLEINET